MTQILIPSSMLVGDLDERQSSSQSHARPSRRKRRPCLRCGSPVQINSPSAEMCGVCVETLAPLPQMHLSGSGLPRLSSDRRYHAWRLPKGVRSHPVVTELLARLVWCEDFDTAVVDLLTTANVDLNVLAFDARYMTGIVEADNFVLVMRFLRWVGFVLAGHGMSIEEVI